jgi:hypothetical protein
MRQGRWLMVVCILACSALWVESGRSAGQSPTPPNSPQQDERPTLRPRNAPPGEIAAPDNSTTSDPHKLVEIKSLYIESIDNFLNEKLVVAFENQGRFRLATNLKQADAVLRGSCLESRRLKHVHSEVFISDRSGGAIWHDSIYRPFSPPSLDEAVAETAKLVEAHLESSIRVAER